jgi:hypothetical protein
MIRRTKTWTRPNTSVKFHKSDSEFSAYIKETYIDTGKRLSKDKILSEDKLTLTLVTTWVDQAAHDEFVNDARVHADVVSRKSYNTANGIQNTNTEPAHATVETI